MWIKLLQPVTGLFFPSETLRAGTVVSIGDPKGRKLIGQGKAVRHAFPASDPDDVEALRDKYRQVNGPLWDDEPRRSPPSGSPSGSQAAFAALNLDARVQRMLGPRSAKYQRRRQAEAGSVTPPAAKLKDRRKTTGSRSVCHRPSLTSP
jgi:hypothetical protein